ncbi:hypothetical protein [Planctomicrobium sp. SH664]|uniref:hypothetical protein n=1 Tax=Planctomicrobium sp. SH664 TaxID=3448125 RepID=UPI003F5BACB9
MNPILRRTAFRICSAFLLGVIAWGMASILPVATACPFCSAPSLTLAEQLDAAQAGILVQWVGGKPADREKSFIGETEYEILQVVRDETQKLEKGKTVTLDRFRTGNKGDLYLLLGTVVDGAIEWSTPLEVTETSFNYIVQAPSKESPPTERLAYFLKFLEFPDTLIAVDAYSEFSNAPYEDIVPLADRMPREKIIGWLKDPDTEPTHIGLYGLLLGLCGKPEDAEFMKELIIKETDTFRLGIDGVMGGYLLLAGTPGLKTINESKLINADVPFSETFAAMQALRFMWTYGKGRIPAEDLRASMRLLLDRPTLADLVIVDLARWNDWSIMDRLMQMYQDKNYDVPAIKRAIIRFMLIAEKEGTTPAKTTPGTDASAEAGDKAADSTVAAEPKQEPASNAPKVIGPHVEKATANLKHLRETDPATVKAAERFFFD